MNSSISDYQKVAALLTGVLDNTLTVKDALSEWPAILKTSDSVLKSAYSHLWHYSADEDIRRREPEYAQSQLALLTECLAVVNEHIKIALNPKN